MMVLKQVGVAALQGGFGYVTDVVTGHMGMKLLRDTESCLGQKGREWLGCVGELGGRMIGKAIAGAELPKVSEQMHTVGNLFKAAGNMVINFAATKVGTSDAAKVGAEAPDAAKVGAPDVAAAQVQGQCQAEGDSSWMSTAWEVVKFAPPLITGLVTSTGVVSMAVQDLVQEGMNAVPKVFSALTSTEKVEGADDLVGHVIVPFCKKLVNGTLGKLVGNIVRYDQVMGIYDNHVKYIQSFGETAANYLPEGLGNKLITAANWMGNVDAGRVAMSKESVQQAVKTGDAVGELTTAALNGVTALVEHQVKGPSSSWVDTAKKAGWVAAGVLAGATIVVLTPNVAPILAAGAALGVADKVVEYVKTFFQGSSKEAENSASQENSLDSSLQASQDLSESFTEEQPMQFTMEAVSVGTAAA